MATTLAELDVRLTTLEEKVERLSAEERGNGSRQRGTETPLQRWLAERSAKPPIDMAALRRELGIPSDLPRMTAEEIQQLMLSEGVKPEDCILSSEIIRVREESRP